MFNSLQKTFQLYKPTKTTNSLNEDIINYQPTEKISAFISLNTSSFEKGQPQEVMGCEYSGNTTYPLAAGDRLDDYLVKYVIPASNQFFFYCTRYER